MIAVMGLDVSTKRTGVALPTGRTISIVPKTTENARRAHFIVGQLARQLRIYEPAVVVIEGYAPHSIGTLSTIRLAEVGGAIRVLLFELGVPYVEVVGSAMKRFATGNGAADKDRMVRAATAAGATPANHDEADAFVARAVGLLAYGVDLFERDEENRAARLEVAAAVTWPPIEGGTHASAAGL